MPFIAVGDITVHYAVAGPPSAPALVLINALGTDFRIWDGVVAALAGRFRVLVYDKRGHGLTSGSAGPYDGTQLVGDLLGLMSAAGLERATLVGLSVGGLIAQLAATAAPERIERLVLCNTAPKFGTPDSWTDRMAAVRAGGLAALAPGVMEKWFSPGFRAAAPATVAGIAAMLGRADVEGYLSTCGFLRDTDARDNAGRIGQETLVVGGDFDGSTPPDVVADLAGRLPSARLVLLPTGHLGCVERPAELADLITRHVAD